MNFNNLQGLIMKELRDKIENHKGLTIFAKNRAKFEGWLKVELVNILQKQCPDVEPEKELVDISFKDWLIELKTVNTNYKYKGVPYKTRPITENVKGVIEDIKQLRKKKSANKAVLFIVFPVDQNSGYWQKHLEKIDSNLSACISETFKFNNSDIPGIIYLGLVK